MNQLSDNADSYVWATDPTNYTPNANQDIQDIQDIQNTQDTQIAIDIPAAMLNEIDERICENESNSGCLNPTRAVQTGTVSFIGNCFKFIANCFYYYRKIEVQQVQQIDRSERADQSDQSERLTKAKSLNVFQRNIDTIRRRSAIHRKQSIDFITDVFSVSAESSNDETDEIDQHDERDEHVEHDAANVANVANVADAANNIDAEHKPSQPDSSNSNSDSSNSADYANHANHANHAEPDPETITQDPKTERANSIIRSNLQVIASIKPGQKLYEDYNGSLSIDNSYIQSIVRMITGNSRTNTIARVITTIESANSAGMIELIDDAVLDGLRNLIQTYSNTPDATKGLRTIVDPEVDVDEDSDTDTDSNTYGPDGYAYSDSSDSSDHSGGSDDSDDSDSTEPNIID